MENKKLKQEILEKYSKMFSITDERSPMRYGLEVGDGWLPLIEKLCKLLQWDTDKNEYPQVVVDQVKEKFGTLRFYYHTENIEGYDYSDYKDGCIAGTVAFAESMSSSICESCGKPGTINDSGWRATRCEQCKKENN